MIVEFELQGSKCLHKGLFDTTGFWVRFEAETSNGYRVVDGKDEFPERVDGYKIFSHFSFSFYHEDGRVTDLVYSKLVSVLRGAQNAEIENIGFIRKLNK